MSADVTELAVRLIAAPSVNPPGDEGTAVAVLAGVCDELGLHHTVEPALGERRPNILISPAPLRAGVPKLAFLGHSDVVPPGPGWHQDPFEARVQNGRLYGRGSVDMKGGLAAVLLALAEAGPSAVAGGIDPVLVVAVDEEEGGRGTQHFVQTHPDWDLRACVIAEPTGLQVIRAAKGNAYYAVDLFGRSAHASRPDNGRSAISAAARVVTDLATWHAELRRPADPLVGPPTWNVGTIAGGSGTAIVPARCRIMVDRRMTPDQTAVSVQADLEDRIAGLDLAADGITVTVTNTMEMPGFHTRADDPLVQLVQRLATETTGVQQEVGGWAATCDGGFVANAFPGCAVVLCGPGDVDGQAHRPDESVAVRELEQATELFTRLLAAYR